MSLVSVFKLAVKAGLEIGEAKQMIYARPVLGIDLRRLNGEDDFDVILNFALILPGDPLTKARNSVGEALKDMMVKLSLRTALCHIFKQGKGSLETVLNVLPGLASEHGETQYQPRSKDP
jgi:hypothetical protein